MIFLSNVNFPIPFEGERTTWYYINALKTGLLLVACGKSLILKSALNYFRGGPFHLHSSSYVHPF